MNTGYILEQIDARPASDGDGVKLLRVFGGARPERFDPFLLLDEFGSEEASDYIGGFPAHPHRGFSTITYMLKGKMEHRDHMDNVGLLNDGDVQWMSAGKGVIHSEMPQQTKGKMRGFQLWLNLPSDEKMQPANYHDVASDDIPLIKQNRIEIKAIAGQSHINGEAVSGYFQVPRTEPIYLDLTLQAEAELTLDLSDKHNAMLYLYEGNVKIGENQQAAVTQTLNRLEHTGRIKINNTTQQEARLLFLAGIPIEEPIVQYGPFVMNSMAEIDQALEDYREGVLTR
ncbi:MAG: pirin family protein [Agarilytica sp.]